ncbi:MAG TPA: hypothetical protein PLI83_11775, partial [Thermomonas sp.]|nr:hypothetical protein [Thermomonas sp.]
VVETPSPNATVIKRVIDDLGDRLRREPEYFGNVQSSVNLNAMRRKALQCSIGCGAASAQNP